VITLSIPSCTGCIGRNAFAGEESFEGSLREEGVEGGEPEYGVGPVDGGGPDDGGGYVLLDANSNEIEEEKRNGSDEVRQLRVINENSETVGIKTY
tara:strand:+ start:507 stop:794 length:288 start_codon:yes stop_codon:yes gene_type:complete